MLFAAGCLAIFLGVAHSILGERLIFKKLRQKAIVPTYGGELFTERQVRILWVSWHLVTLFGAALGSLLCYLSVVNSTQMAFVALLVNFTSIVMFCAALLALVGTKGKHPSWIILMLIGLLAWLT